MSLATPLLYALALLAVLAFLLWLVRRSPFDWLGGWLPDAPGGPASAVETLRQRYARGEIDEATFATMLDQLESSHSSRSTGRVSASRAADEVTEATGDEAWQFQPRADRPIDWS